MSKAKIDPQHLYRLYQKGWTLAELRAHYHIGNIQEVLAGFQLRPAGAQKIPIDPSYLRRCAKKKMTTYEISLTLAGCSEEVIRRRMVKLGIPRLKKGAQSGAKNHAWTGGRVIDRDGYVLLYLPDHPSANSNGYIREHRLVMENKLGRLLLRSEVVHHRDKDRKNNDPSNLQLFGSNGQHLKKELTGHRPNWTEDGWQRILNHRPRKAQKAYATPSE